MKGVTRQTGIISDIDEVKVCVRVTLPECDDLRTNWLPILQRNSQNNKDYWLPDIGEQVEVLLDDNGEDGVVLGAVYSSVDTAPVASLDKRYVQFADGAAFEYDRKEHQLTINGGIEKIVIEVKTSISATTQKVEITASDSVTVTTSKATVRADTIDAIAEKVTVKATTVTVDAPQSVFTGNVIVQKKLTWNGGMEGKGGTGDSAVITGNVRVRGNVGVSGSVLDGSGNSNHHSH
ncbi:phage baseplate assembly protein V [Salmonella enterica]|uniref:phage baseplate assembly protein V n=1 Tax=Salmonella enterica TaxID=28901 RepID=UPI0021D4E6F0|nr:phage baseplate assembly protein V [Salmonella enterica]MCU7097927.1 phage baseplate assembly protein V [Salmonella enterica]MCU7116332.1 phage baseplate assembly protein V [Salmonella enterica]MCU7122432.1 phage baseplate assembly protein V [Salmonella enterica]